MRVQQERNAADGTLVRLMLTGVEVSVNLTKNELHHIHNHI